MSLAPLLVPTPQAWIQTAVRRWPELLSDHAHCEKKAASTAIALMFSYPEDIALLASLSRLAREELRHFEQVHRIMQEHGVANLRCKPGRYAPSLRAAMRAHEPVRKLDILLTGALIEARSCERFKLLSSLPADQGLPASVATLYAQLGVSEARHFELYLKLAERHAKEISDTGWQERLITLATVEAELVTAVDLQFRFHSGTPEDSNKG